MKALLILLVGISLTSFAEEPEVKSEIYTVVVETTKGNYKFKVRAPSDLKAIDSVYVAAIYNKKMGTPKRAVVMETELASENMPRMAFTVKTEKRIYPLAFHVADPDYILTAIQAAKLIMSKTETINIVSHYDGAKLRDRKANQFVVKFKDKEKTLFLHAKNIEEGLIALDIAARVSQYADNYVGTIAVDNMSLCLSMFSD